MLSPAALLLSCAAVLTATQGSGTEETFEVIDARTMGIRETIRTEGLTDCLQRCVNCEAVVMYPDGLCLIFDIPIPSDFIVSYGASCCARNLSGSLECFPCSKHSTNQHPEFLEGPTNVVGVWAINSALGASYKVLPYDCQATPDVYQSRCEAERAHLASVLSSEEEQFISALADTTCHCKHIGLRRMVGSDVFQWRDGSQGNYTKWMRGEPIGRGSLCVHIWRSAGWASTGCSLSATAPLACCAVCKKHIA